MGNQQSIRVAWIVEIHRQLNELLPDVELVRNSNERLEVADGAFWILLSQERLVLNQLLSLTVLIECHYRDA